MKKTIYVMSLVVCILLAVSVQAKKKPKVEEPPVVLGTEMDKVSYSIGANIGQNFHKSELKINLAAFIQGLKDAMAGSELLLTEADMQQIMQNFQKEMMDKQRKLMEEQNAKNLAEAQKFLAKNKTQEGVITLPSGLQYKVITAGTGTTPTATDKVKTHYKGTLLDGTEFDSSYKRNAPATFGVTGVIKGWTEALQLMKEGAKWELYIPANLAYGERGTRNIPPNSALIFEIELLEVIKPAPPKTVEPEVSKPTAE